MVDYNNRFEADKEDLKQEYISNNKNEIEKNIDTISRYINNQYTNKMQYTKTNLQNHVNNAYNIINGIYNDHKDTKSKEEIIKIIKSVLLNIRFNDGRGYFFIYERTGKNILNAEFRNLEGKNLWEFQDAKGVYLLKEMYEILNKQNEAFYKWYWKETKNSNKISQKIGLFKKFEPYNWFIGTGEYLDYFNKELEDKIITHLQNLKYANNRYVFVLEENGTLLLSQNNLYNNKNIFTNEKLKYLSAQFKKFIDSSEKRAYVQYKTKFSENVFEKISLLSKVDHNNWIIGTGFNLENLNIYIKKQQNKLNQAKDKYLKKIGLISIVITMILLIIAYYISSYLEKLFLNYKNKIESKNEKLREAHQIAKLGEWELDLSTQKAYWSEDVKKMLGVDLEQEVGLEYLKTIMHKDDWNKFEKSITSCALTGSKHFSIYRIIKPSDGKTIWIECRGKLTNNNTVIGTVQDMTDIKLIELENNKQQNLIYQQSKMATMGEMINNIAHQWKQPLSTISMISGSIRVDNELDSIEKDILTKSVDDIDNSIKYLSQTIDDFRNFFKPDKNVKNKFFFKYTIEKTLKLISYRLKISSIEVITDIEDIELESIENQLIQVVINLLNNSKDAFDEHPNIERKLIFINGKKVNNNYIIKIYDNARGIPEEILPKIFQAYFTTKEETGTGIGLYMSQEITHKLLNGSLEVSNLEYEYENIKYNGACFMISLNISELK